jgi:prepilin-type processing-associated H-X9-DG protein
MKAPPASTKDSLTSRLNEPRPDRWPELAGIEVRFRANFAYVDGRYADGDRAQAVPPALRRIGPHLGVCHLPGQPRRLRGLLPPEAA